MNVHAQDFVTINKIMDFAVVRIGGKQFRVSKGDVLEVQKIAGGKGKIKLEDVLLTSENGKVKIGSPTVKNAFVTASLVEEKKGEKIRVSKYKAKVRYRRTMGFRPILSLIKIDNIEY